MPVEYTAGTLPVYQWHGTLTDGSSHEFVEKFTSESWVMGFIRIQKILIEEVWILRMANRALPPCKDRASLGNGNRSVVS